MKLFVKLIWKIFVTICLLIIATGACLFQFVWTFSLDFKTEFKLEEKEEDAPFSKAIPDKVNIFKSPFHHIIGCKPERFYTR